MIFNFKLMNPLWYALLLASLISCNPDKTSAQSKLPVRTITLLGQDGKKVPVQVEVADTDPGAYVSQVCSRRNGDAFCF
jgi:hypothetical protein